MRLDGFELPLTRLSGTAAVLAINGNTLIDMLNLYNHQDDQSKVMNLEISLLLLSCESSSEPLH